MHLNSIALVLKRCDNSLSKSFSALEIHATALRLALEIRFKGYNIARRSYK